MKQIPGIFGSKWEMAKSFFWVVILMAIVVSLTVGVFRSMVGR